MTGLNNNRRFNLNAAIIAILLISTLIWLFAIDHSKPSIEPRTAGTATRGQ